LHIPHIILPSFILTSSPPPKSTLFPYTTLFRSLANFIVPSFYVLSSLPVAKADPYKGAPYIDFLRDRNTDYSRVFARELLLYPKDRKSTRLNSSHVAISYAVFCLKKKNNYARSH